MPYRPDNRTVVKSAKLLLKLYKIAFEIMQARTYYAELFATD